MALAPGILFGLIAMVSYGLANALSPVPAKRIGATKTIFYRNLIISFLVLASLLFSLKSATFSLKYILLAVLISIIGYVPLMSFYHALKIGKVGVVSPIANSSVIVTVALSIVFFQETLSSTQIVSIILIIAGMLLISLNFKDLKKSHLFSLGSGIPYALITCALWGVVFFLLKIPVDMIGPVLTSLIIEAGVTVYSSIHIAITKKGFNLPDKKSFKYIILIALLGTAGSLFYNFGLALENVSLIAAIKNSSPLVATIYAAIAYKEKLHLQQYMAIVMMVAGIILVSAF